MVMQSCLFASKSYFCPVVNYTWQNDRKTKQLKINELTRKVHFFAFFLQKYLVISKICCTFALAFEKQVCFDFLPESGH